jgi:hypothetical protein
MWIYVWGVFCVYEKMRINVYCSSNMLGLRLKSYKILRRVDR